jgi:6-phosphogluconate dehydrogenase
VIEELAPLLDEGDTIIDGGNSHFRDTQRRDKAMNERGLRFLGVGVSGGEEGALNGPSIMPGGAKEAYADVEDVFTAIAAQVDGTPCCTYVGADGAGHYVKMVHNGIEYADIQLIAEAYDLLRHGVGLEVPEIAQVFHEWNEGDLDSFLIEITATVLDKQDERTGQPLVDVILDQAEQKGTGRWTAQDALELGVPLTAITEAVFARSLSALGDQRAAASKQLGGPTPGENARADRSLVDDVRQALYASKVVAYAQGFEQMTAAAKSEGWELDLGAMATIWRGGCIIRAQFLNRIRDAYAEHGDVENLLMVPYFSEAVANAQDAWRRVVMVATEQGVAIPAFASSSVVLRRLPARAGPGQPDPGPARLLRRPHLPAHGRRGLLAHPLEPGRQRGADGWPTAQRGERVDLAARRKRRTPGRARHRAEVGVAAPPRREDLRRAKRTPPSSQADGRKVTSRALHTRHTASSTPTKRGPLR